MDLSKEEKMQKILFGDLAEELLKEAPLEKKVCELMSKLGLPPETDPVLRLELVLQAIGGINNSHRMSRRKNDLGQE